MKHPTFLSRRDFLSSTAFATGGLMLIDTTGFARTYKANEKLNLGIIGPAGRGGENLKEVGRENIVALCDVDSKNLDAASKKHPSAKTHSDYRQLLSQKDVDAVVISTPDHTHAVIATAALRSGRHVYCEKPLGHTISEVRRITELARTTGLVTQTGNQIHATENYHRVVEIVRGGVIGPIRETHHWVDIVWEPKERPAGGVAPAHLDYEMWLGPVAHRPYSSEYLPFNWRRWWAFGGGTLADFCCHHMDLAVWALDLDAPVSVETEGPAPHPECVPSWLKVRYEFAARGNRAPVKVHWYHGGKRPPQFEQSLLPKWGNGSLFLGDKGMLLANYSKHILLPEKSFADFQAPSPTLPRSVGHQKEWIAGCKNGAQTSCHFGYGGPLSELGLLGNVAFRTGRKIQWDAALLKARNCPEADQFIQHHYRSGWEMS